MSLIPFEKLPRSQRLSELQKIVIGDRLSVRALGERNICAALDSNYPKIKLGAEIIEKVTASPAAPIQTSSTEAAGRVAVQAPVPEVSTEKAPTNVIPISAAKSYEPSEVEKMKRMADEAREKITLSQIDEPPHVKLDQAA